jgi:hypothetical protein
VSVLRGLRIGYRLSARRGQSLVETALILPVLLLIVCGTLEFGFAFDHHLTLQYATREGARVGSALVNGGGTLGCGAGQSPNAGTVDPAIVAAVERVLASTSSPIDLNRVSEIRIYKADANGAESGPVDRWIYAPAGGPVVDGKALDFKSTAPQTWSACGRVNGATPDSIGVSVAYTYDMRTPMQALFGWATISMGDRSVMSMNPTN